MWLILVYIVAFLLLLFRVTRGLILANFGLFVAVLLCAPPAYFLGVALEQSAPRVHQGWPVGLIVMVIMLTAWAPGLADWIRSLKK